MGAWLPGFSPVRTLVADRSGQGVGPTGRLGQKGVPGLPGPLPSDAPGTQGGVPCCAYPGAIHPPSEMPPPHSHAAAGRGRSGHAHVDAGALLSNNLNNPGPSARPRRAPGGGGGGPCPPGGSVPDPVRQRSTTGHPPGYLRDGAGPGFPSPGRPLHGGQPRAIGAYPEGAGAGPQGNPGTTGMADPPRCRPDSPAEGAPAAVAGSAQGLGPGRHTHLLGGSSHRRPGGQNHPHGDHIPQGTAPPGDRGHAGYHGDGGLGARTQGVPPTPRRAVQ